MVLEQSLAEILHPTKASSILKRSFFSAGLIDPSFAFSSQLMSMAYGDAARVGVWMFWSFEYSSTCSFDGSLKIGTLGFFAYLSHSMLDTVLASETLLESSMILEILLVGNNGIISLSI